MISWLATWKHLCGLWEVNMPKVSFITQSSAMGDNIAFSAERLINLYPEGGPQGAKGALLMRSVLGEESFADLGTNVLRAMATVGGTIYAVGGGSLFSVSSGGTVSNLGDVTDDPITTIDGNGTSVTVTAGGTYYVWDGSTLTEPTGGAFTSEGTVSYLDQRTIITEKGGDQFEWTDLADPTTRQALNFARNESKNDNTLRVLADRRELWFFGEESIEVWFNTGQSGADALERLNGGALETGILAALLSVKLDTGIFFIGDDGVAYMTAGLGIAPVSTPAVNRAIEASTPTHCFYYEDRGHKFCIIRFSDRPAWCYDATTGLWHERSSGINREAWDVVAITKAFGEWYSGTTTGDIYKMKRNNVDVVSALKRVAVSREFSMNGEQFSVAWLEWLGTMGDSDLGRDALLMMRLSKDGGRTWTPEKTISIGDLGDYDIRAVFRALGRYRRFNVEFSITEASEISMYSDAHFEVT